MDLLDDFIFFAVLDDLATFCNPVRNTWQWMEMQSMERTASGLLFVLFGCRSRRRSTALGPEEVSNIGHSGDVERVSVDSEKFLVENVFF